MEWVTLDEGSPSGDGGDLAWREARIYGVHREVSQRCSVAQSSCLSTAQNTCYDKLCAVTVSLTNTNDSWLPFRYNVDDAIDIGKIYILA